MTKKPIPTRPLGTTGIQVSELALGTMQFTWTCSAAMGRRVLDAYWAAGGYFIDTADSYTTWQEGNSGGEAETIIGNWMKERKNRRQVVLATKCQMRVWPGTTGEGLSRVHVFSAIDASLQRLRTDYVDLLQCHWPDGITPVEETLRAFDDLIAAGKVRYVGCSNFSSGLFGEALALARWGRYPKLVSVQPRYHLLERDFEKDHAWLAKKYGVAVIPYSPLAGGFLTGKYRKGKPLPDSKRIEWQKHMLGDKLWNVVATLERLGRKRGKTVAQMALGWHLSHDWMTAPIVGANSPEQLKETLGAAGLKLTPDEMKALDEVSK
ncbi:MAG: aldo/keto reductase [Candidatus Coatesbacteria bacterium]